MHLQKNVNVSNLRADKYFFLGVVKVKSRQSFFRHFHLLVFKLEYRKSDFVKRCSMPMNVVFKLAVELE